MAKFYAVRNGRSTGIYTDWSDAKSQVQGYSGNQYKSFSSQAEAVAYMNSGSSQSSGSYASSGMSSSGSYSSPSYSSRSYSSSSYSPSHTSSYSSSYTPSYSSSSKKSATIYTDGASRDNQNPTRARAGYGVYYGDGDSRNVSERLTGRQTNNRAELSAIKHAVDNVYDEVVSGDLSTKYTIATDSAYSKNSLDTWSKSWQRNNWKTASGKDVENRDLIEPTLEKIDVINEHYSKAGMGKMKIEKVEGHSTNYGNNMADMLATRGADKGF